MPNITSIYPGTNLIATTGLGAIDYGVMVIYLLLVVIIGWFYSRGSTNTENYLLGGRSMGWFIVGISYMVSLLSTLTLVMVPGEAYNNGLIMALKNIIGPFFAVLTFFLFIRFYFKTNTFTPFQYLEQRFNPHVRGIAAAAYWLTRLLYLALVLYSSAKVFEGASGWPVQMTILIVGVVGLAYTTMGGIRAVIWTDLVQFVVLALGLGLVFIVAVGQVPGGITGAIEFAFENGRGLEELSEPSFYGFDPHDRINLWIMLLASFSAYLFYNSADQIAIQRLLSTKGYREAKRSLFTFLVLGIPIPIMLWILGLAIFSFYSHGPEANMPKSGDLALFQFIGNELPTPLPGIIIAAMLAAVMSTLDSGINSLATVATKDFYLRMFRPKANETEQVLFSRKMTVFTGIFAIIAGLIISMVSSSIGETIIEASTVWISFASVLGPVFLLGVTTRSLNGRQVIYSMAAGWAGLIPMIIWYIVSRRVEGMEPVGFMYVSLPGLVLPLLVGYTMALFSKRQPNEKIEDLTLLTLSKQVQDKGE